MNARLLLVVATLVGCGNAPSERDRDLRRNVWAYCQLLPSSYKLIVDEARAGRFEEVARLWLPIDHASNLHQKFDLCLSTVGFPEAERMEIFDTYNKDVSAKIRDLITALQNATQSVSDVRPKLISEIERAQALVERIRVAADKTGWR